MSVEMPVTEKIIDHLVGFEDANERIVTAILISTGIPDKEVREYVIGNKLFIRIGMDVSHLVKMEAKQGGPLTVHPYGLEFWGIQFRHETQEEADMFERMKIYEQSNI